jgi:hypothetical protein
MYSFRINYMFPSDLTTTVKYCSVVFPSWQSYCGPEDPGFEFLQGQEFSLHQIPDRLWVPPSRLFNEYHGPLPWRQSGRGVKLSTFGRVKNEWSFTTVGRDLYSRLTYNRSTMELCRPTLRIKERCSLTTLCDFHMLLSWNEGYVD